MVKGANLDTIRHACREVAAGDRDLVSLVSQITDFVDGGKGSLFSAQNGGAYKSVAIFGFDPKLFLEYDDGMNLQDPRKPSSMRLTAGDADTGQSFLSNETLQKVYPGYYNDISLRGNIKDSVHGVIADDPVLGRQPISIQRGFSDDLFGSAEIEKMTAVLPYLSDMLHYAKLVTVPKAAYSCLLAPDLTLFHLDGDPEILRSAPRTQAIVITRKGHDDQLSLNTDGGGRLLRRLWAQAYQGRSHVIRFRHDAVTDHVLTISPAPSLLNWVWPGRKRVLCRIDLSNRDLLTPDASDIYADAFGLTPAEGRVLAALTTGRPSGELALNLGISAETLRWHVKNILSKTRHSRRSDLIQAARSNDLTHLFQDKS